jgi:hypothetical protein
MLVSMVKETLTFHHPGRELYWRSSLSIQIHKERFRKPAFNDELGSEPKLPKAVGTDIWRINVYFPFCRHQYNDSGAVHDQTRR